MFIWEDSLLTSVVVLSSEEKKKEKRKETGGGRGIYATTVPQRSTRHQKKLPS
jgi:hypothetical protein